VAAKNQRYGVCPDCGQTLAGKAVLPHARARAADAAWVELPVHNRTPRAQLKPPQVLVVCLPRGRRRAVRALPLVAAGDPAAG
jgi:hypothetical protein